MRETMMPKTPKSKRAIKTQSTRTRTKTRAPRRPARLPRLPARPGVPTPVAVASTGPRTESPAAPAPVAHAPRRNTTPAMKLGAELVRYLRIHAKHPYGPRGQQAIVDLAKQAAHAASLELAT